MPSYDKQRAKQEALQQPAFDPIMLLASVLSGGLSAVPEGLENNALRQRAHAALQDVFEHPEEDAQATSDLADRILGVLREAPSLLRTVSKGASAAGKRFTCANAFGNLVAPGHPTANNLYALANAPAMNVAKMPRLVQVLKWLQKQMDISLDPSNL